MKHDSSILDFVHDSVATCSWRKQAFQFPVKRLSNSRIGFKKQDLLCDSELSFLNLRSNLGV